jgi:hypothetical protein
MARRWAEGAEVSLEGSVAGAGGRGAVSVLIEKDFQCLHGSPEDQADCFPNPRARESTTSGR